MNTKTWAKTVLTVQKYLDRVCASIDECISKKSTAAFNVNTKNIYKNDCFCVANYMIDLIDRKKSLINLRVICNNALKSIDRLSAKILVLKFIDRMPSATIAKLLNLSERTYFRKLNAAYENFEDYLIQNGFDAEYFENSYVNEGWIMDVYDEISKQTGKTDNVITFTPIYLNKICIAMSK
ncbi:MAG: DUF1492 domain-containing protein [Clostridia bacterium]|nr:DUF1492 domain-containing protein [Clostridia bacterium]